MESTRPSMSVLEFLQSEQVLTEIITSFGDGKTGKRARELVEAGTLCEARDNHGARCGNKCVCTIDIDIGPAEENFPACRDHILPLYSELQKDVVKNGRFTVAGINGHGRA